MTTDVRIPDVISSFFDAEHNEYVYVFEDGAVVKLALDDVANIRKNPTALTDLVDARYLEQRGDKL